MAQDKINAYLTLQQALVTVCKLAAPMIPFMTEEIYRNLRPHAKIQTAPLSIHLCEYPTADHEMIDQELETDMDLVLRIVFTGRAARNGANIKNRQPLGQMFVSCDTADNLPEECCTIMCEELNIKEIHFDADAAQMVSYGFKPPVENR